MSFCYRSYAKLLALVLLVLFAVSARAQEANAVPPVVVPEVKPPVPGVPLNGPDPTAVPEDKRVFGVLPNYRTAEKTAVYHPISAKYKMTIALKDSFDTPLMVIGATYALLYQAEDSHPEFGQGVKGYLHRLGTSYADQVIGNMLTEGFMPIALHEDPRYFRMAEGPGYKRALYAASRIFVTKTDKGNATFNYAEVIGNGIASGIGLAYYPDSRNPGDYVQNWAIQLATDASSQVLKEFWPDIKRHMKNRHKQPANLSAAATN